MSHGHIYGDSSARIEAQIGTNLVSANKANESFADTHNLNATSDYNRFHDESVFVIF